MSNGEGRLGRALILRLDFGQPLSALSPAWAALAGLLVSGAMGWDARTFVVSVLLLFLVEPVMGGLWDLAVGYDPAPILPSSGGDEARVMLPYARPGSAGYRLTSALADGLAGWRDRGWPAVVFVGSLIVALAVASVLGLVLLGVALAVIVLVARLHWRAGGMSLLLQAIYDALLPWLMGMSALGQIAERGPAFYRSGLLLAACYLIVYVACLSLVNGVRLPALIVLDGVQVALLGFLITRQEIPAVWLVGLCLVGQLAAHPAFLGGGSATSYVRRSSVYIVLAMLAAAIALAPTLAGL